MLLAGLLAQEVQAQIYNGNPYDTGANQRQNSSDRFNGFGRFGELDSLRNDSTQIEDIEIEPDLYYISPMNIFRHKETLERKPWDIWTLLQWDDVERGDGFYYHLGQIGKPYRIFEDGMDENVLSKPFWEDPIMKRYNRYAFTARESGIYQDTKTPYINVDLIQGSAQTSTATVLIGRNITPRWNMVFNYNRKNVVGAYRDFNTAHQSATLSSYYKSKTDRYHLFATGAFTEMKNSFHGGVYLGPDSIYQRSGDIFQQNDSLVDAVYAGSKEQIRLLLTGAEANQIVRSLYLDQFYHLLGSDTTVHKFTLRASGLYEQGYRRYIDSDLSTGESLSDLSFINDHPVSVYPTWDTDSTFLSEAYRTNRFGLSGGASYSINGPVRLQADATFSLGRLEWQQDSGRTNQNTVDQDLYGQIDVPGISASIRIFNRISTQFDNENKISLRGTFSFLPKKSAYKLVEEAVVDSIIVDSMLIDSVLTNAPKGKPTAKAPPKPKKKSKDEEPIRMASPLTLTGEYDQFSLNPSLFQTFFRPRGSNTFMGNRDLKNQNLTRVSARLRYSKPALIRNDVDTLLSSFFEVKGFFSRMGRPIYYDSEMQPLQAATGESISWVGAEVNFRTRLFWYIYTRGKIAVQQGTSSVTDNAALSTYANNIPDVYGTLSFFYDNTSLSIADLMRIGVDIHAFNSYQGMTVDPVSGEFFPANYEVPGFARADAYFAIRIKRTYAYLKVSNVGEGFPQPAYFTTPAYPMLQRTITIGVNWSFFD
ncbi:MAG: putative porin [Bacteroidota bacterium]